MDSRTARLAASLAVAVAVPAALPGVALAGGDLDFDGPFSGSVSSEGGWSNFTVVRCDPDGHYVAIRIDDFTSPSGRAMVFAANKTDAWEAPYGSGTATIAKGDTEGLHIGDNNHCWRFKAKVAPGRDTNGTLSPGWGVTSFDGNLKY